MRHTISPYGYGPTGQVRPGTRPTSNFTVVPPGWDDKWRAAKAVIATRPAGILFNGDSLMNGGPWITNPFTQAFPDLIRRSLIAKYNFGSYGDWYSPWAYTFSSGSAPASSAAGGYTANQNAPFSALANTGATAYQTDDAAFGRGIEPLATSGTFMTITFTGTGFELILASIVPTTTVFIQVDGNLPTGAVVTGASAFVGTIGSGIVYTNHGPNGWNANPVDKLIVTGLANQSHTITIPNPSTAHGLVLCGFASFSGAAGGLMTCRNGNSGALEIDAAAVQTSADLNGRAVLPQYRDRLWTGGAAGINGTNGVWLSTNPFGWPTGCDLIVDNLATNDISQQVPPAAVVSAKNRVWRAHRRANPNCSIIAMIPSMPDGVTSDNAPFVNGQFSSRYKQAIYDLAANYNAAVVDIDAMWGPKGVALGYQNAGDIHPTIAGHRSIAAAIGGLL